MTKRGQVNERANGSTQSGHPSGDERYKAIDLTMKRFKYQKDALLEVLNTAQATFGYLSPDLMVYVSQQLQVPLVKVYGVATFYHMFTFDPLGEHNAIICTGTACHVKGSHEIVKALAEEFGIKEGETTPDGLFSLTTARCLGSCGLAPVTVLDGKVRGKETAASLLRHIHEAIIRTQEAKHEQ
ncbi:MAG: bidirectional hydrogenase complex protein HoxE [Candidatus Promineifilaceae bacterium]